MSAYIDGVDDIDAPEVNDVVFKIQKAVMIEKQSPEILQYKKDLVDHLDNQIKGQQEALSGMEITADENFVLDVYQLELERMKYMLKSYIRTRLTKIEKSYLYIIKNDKADLLSDQEVNYAWDYFWLRKGHFDKCFANELPAAFVDFIDDGDDGKNANHPNNPVNPEMVTAPDVHKFVFVKPNKTGKVSLNDNEGFLDLKPDDVLLLPYALTHELVESGIAEMV